jgi:hypothetical protein
MELGLIYPIFGEEFSFREELAARIGEISRQSLRPKAIASAEGIGGRSC